MTRHQEEISGSALHLMEDIAQLYNEETNKRKMDRKPLVIYSNGMAYNVSFPSTFLIRFLPLICFILSFHSSRFSLDQVPIFSSPLRRFACDQLGFRVRADR